MELTGAQIVIETLLEQGATTIFGYPGGAVLNIYDELYKSQDRINHIISAHEQGAVHAADGYARTTGKVGVVVSTSGPGATNLVTGIANAYLDSTPIVAITGNVATPLLGKDSFQEVDIVSITKSITRSNYIVKDITKLADTIREAFRVAKSGRPGPVLIDIPKDIQVAKCEYIPHSEVEKFPYPVPSDDEIITAAKLINEASRPIIYCGGGVVISDSSEELIAFADKIDAPISFSIMGLSAVPKSYNGFLGMSGMHGKYASSKAKSEADLIIAIGVRFSDRATGDKDEYAKNAKILHIDIDDKEFNKNINVDMCLKGNIKDVLKILTQNVCETKHIDWENEVLEIRRTESLNEVHDNEFTPSNIIETVQKYMPNDAVVATDVGQHQMWVAQYYSFKRPRTFITSGGLGTMGFGMGAAIGSCVGNDRKKTVLFTGDGSFGMNLNEMATAVSCNLPLIIVIMNNGVLGMVRQWQSLFYGQRFSSTTLNRKTDFVALAKAFGADGYKAENLDDLNRIFNDIGYKNGPVVIDCHINMDERVLPMIPPGGCIDDIILN